MLRTLFAVLLISMTSVSISQATGNDFTTKNDTSSKNYSAQALTMSNIQEALNEGIWVETQNTQRFADKTQEISFQFHDFGMVDVFHTDLDGTAHVEHLFYSISENPFGVVLDLSNPPIESSYHLTVLEYGPDQMLVELNGKTMQLSLESDVLKNVESQLESQLIGSWEMYSYPYDVITDINECGTFEEIDGAKLTYDFREDGSYTRVIGSDFLEITETGFYEVSKDGSYLTFHAAADNNPELVYATHVAQIETLDHGQLNINQTLSLPYSEFESLFCTCNKTFILNKATLASAQ